MKNYPFFNTSFKFCPVGIVACLMLFGCDQDMTPETNNTSSSLSAPTVANNEIPDYKRLDDGAGKENSGTTQTQFHVGNKKYLFDVSDHSVAELEALLERADEITQMPSDDYAELEIVMILHGPDIDWFKQQNYESNKRMVDLAEKLDANEIIDLKVCETAMTKMGVQQDELPAFIETVPYAPDEMKRLFSEGYINM